MGSSGLPFNITRYLCGKWTERTIFVYLIVNKEGFIVDWSENISSFYGIKPNRNEPADEQLLFLQGLFPYQSNEVLVLETVNFSTNRAADIHLVPAEDDDLCILMFDVTESLKLRQQLQQKSNDIHLLYEQELRSIKGLQQAYQKAQKQRTLAEQANRAKSEFLSQITHDLKSPLNAILGFAQLLELSDYPLVGDQQNYVNEIKSAGDYLLKLINELLDTAKIENGKIKIEAKSLNLYTIINSLIELLKVLAEKDKISFINQINPQVPNVWVDQVRLKQIIVNLLSNAIKYNRPGGCIIISYYIVNQDTMRISIKDTGIGIEACQLDNMFEAYERGPAQYSDIEGTGIGLNVCKLLANLMRGSVGAHSNIGEGSIFWLDIPLDKEVVVSKPAKKQHNVLYLEQVKMNVDLMQSLLSQRLDCKLYNVIDLKSVLDFFETQTPDIILINTCSFKHSYLDYLKDLQTHPATKNIPIVAIFDRNTAPVEIKMALQAGFNDYINQPFDFNFAMMLFDRLLS